MKKVKGLFVLFMVIIFCFYVTTTDHLFSFKLLLTASALMVILLLILYKESLQKFNSLIKLDIELTRGFVFCAASLPILYMLWSSRHIELVNQKIFAYLLTLLLAIFNYGIRSKTKN
ncbi:hypothetical protein C8N25_1524 [Algoriphagus antarcticus]|uniref:Uncharacterized protein n=1 Tax=Algoriphagus antarcticus TaxID=238540 RepID=A0A3E0D5S4_9BACT|nr:hypothetical protein C8N25_1524 [Algoriphagus antarcticus]